MYSDSRKAQHHSFARHRADMLFRKLGERKHQTATASSVLSQEPPDDRVESLRRRINAGILGQRHSQPGAE